MSESACISPWSVLLPVGLGTGLSLIGDASLYAVLPTHVADAGVPLASVGILLSANRFIRLLLNAPAGMAYDRWRRRPLFLTSLFIGALSTALYALARGFWPLLGARLLWGLAWSGIWVGGNAIIADISERHNRGRWVGYYQISFFMGTATGSLAGGLLTDALGYHAAMWVGASLTLAGALVALFFLPETFHPKDELVGPEKQGLPPRIPEPAERAQMASAVALMGVNRLTLAGMLAPTLGLFLLETTGGSARIAGMTLGVATLTGMGLGMFSLVSMVSAPIMGRLSDRGAGRWQTITKGLMPGVAGFGLLAFAHPLTILLGLPLAAFAGGSNQGLSAATVGDLSAERQRGRNMGILFTVGDLTSAIGPPLAYALMPFAGLTGLYLFSSALLMAMMLVAMRWAARTRDNAERACGHQS